MIEIILSCVSFSSKILLNKIGPKSLTVARSLAPGSSEIDKNSTGEACGSKGKLRASILSCAFLSSEFAAAPIPDKSPLISINNVGTPFRESCSAIICKDFVFPVPVAPPINP